MRRLRYLRDERGAAAVEFALLLPVLLLLVFGLMEFSRLYNVQISLSNAAREGARSMAIENNTAVARSAAIAAAPSVTPAITAAQISVSPSPTCAAGATATVRITYDVALMTGWFGPNLTLTGTGAMRCGG
jgi:Flp pilus assembly protein TadG